MASIIRKRMMTVSNIFGTLGVGILLIAFVLLTLKAVKPDSHIYYLLNLVGAALAGYSSWLIGFMPFVVLEAFWVIVSAAGILKLSKNKDVPRGKGQKNV